MHEQLYNYDRYENNAQVEKKNSDKGENKRDRGEIKPILRKYLTYKDDDYSITSACNLPEKKN